jgi:predicted nucleotidyltransferase
VRNGLVRSQPAGNARLYTFNREHVAGPAITTLVSLREELVSRMTADVDSWRIPALAVWLFGSAARGEAGPDSDIDVFVLRPDDVPDSDQTWQVQVDNFSMRVSQ